MTITYLDTTMTCSIDHYKKNIVFKFKNRIVSIQYTFIVFELLNIC